MNGSDFSGLCLAYGLSVTPAGIVTDDVNDYCLIRPNLIQLPGNEIRTYFLDAIDTVNYSDERHCMTIGLFDGTR